MVDVIVIGAGIGGLAAAAELSASGLRVVVVEAQSEVGGKLGRGVVDGVEFDTGPSVLTMRDVFEDLYTACNTSLEQELTLLHRDHIFEYRWPDGTRLEVEFDLQETLANVGNVLGDPARKQLEEFLEYARQIWESAAPNFVYGDAPTIGSALTLGLTRFRQLMRIDPMRTMAAGIESRVTNSKLRDILYRYATYNGSDPWSAPATLNCIAWVELGLGCYGISNGMYDLARSLEDLATRHGARFEVSTRAERILKEGSRVTGVVLDDGRVLPCSRVLVNADVAHLGETLMPESKIQSPGEASMSGWNAVIKARRQNRPSHLVLFPEREYREEFRDIFERHRPPQEPTVYVCAQGVAHERAGWEEHEPLFVMANAPPEPTGGSDATRWTTLEERVLGRLHDSGILEHGDEIVWRRTPTDLASRYPGTRGAIYGAASNSQFSAFQRPSNRIASVDGLYLAGGSAHPGGGVPLCVLSGRAACRAILEDS